MITAAESRDFRTLRRIMGWMTVGAAVSIGIAARWPRPLPQAPLLALLVFLYGGSYFTICFQVITWRCPRCGRPFSSRISWFYGITWPWFDDCMHCGARLEKEPRDTR